jgi:hypothetical protein
MYKNHSKSTKSCQILRFSMVFHGFPSEDDAFTHETHLPAVAEPWPRSSTLLGEKAVALRRGGEVHIVSAAGAVPLEKNRVFPPWGAVILLAKMGECLRIPCNSCFEVV